MPCSYDGFALFGTDALTDGPEQTRPGAPCPDAPIGDDYLLDQLDGSFVVVAIGDAQGEAVAVHGVEARLLTLEAPTQAMRMRYLSENHKGAVYLIRPDQHIVARWETFDKAQVENALALAIGKQQ